MKLTNINGITTRVDGLPYDVRKTANGFEFRAIANPANPVVITTTKTENEAIMMLVAQAPEDTIQASINILSHLLTKSHFSNAEKNRISARIAELQASKVGA